MASGSTKVVLAALIGNGLIAITKFIASAFTGSSAMLSEAIHSLVDTLNQGLIMFGLKRSKKPADKDHPFGYGMEIYFWTFVVAILIFSIGSGIALYEGIHKVMHPEQITNAWVNYLVLGLAMCFESVALYIANKEFKLTKGRLSYMQAIRKSKKAAIFTVLLEDTAAMLGLMIAFFGLLIGQVFNIPEMDGVASIIIGIVLALVAVILSIETKTLLIGEAATPKTRLHIRKIIEEHKEIEGVNSLLTMHMAPEDILLNLGLDFNNKISAGEVEVLIAKINKQIKQELPEIKRIYIEPREV